MRGFELLVLLAALVLFSCTLSVSAQSTQRTYRVLVLYWDNKDFPGNMKFDEGFRAGLKRLENGTVEYYPEYLETTRFPAQDQAFFHEYLRNKYAGRNIDLVVTTADIPLNFLLQYRADLFPTSPIVFVAIDFPSAETLAAGAGATGIIHQRTYQPTLDLALKLHPNTNQVFVISGSPEHDKRFETVARQELGSFAGKVGITYLTDLPLNELIRRTASLPPRSIALYVWQQALDEQGKILETFQVLGRISPTSAVPIYGMGSGNLGEGLVGGYLQGPEINGSKTAEIALRILNGTRAQDIPVANAPTVAMFDWRQIERWGIKENNLPPDSVIKFREVTFWQLYKWYIIGLIAAVIIEAMLIAWLLLLRTRRRQAENENLRLAQIAKNEHTRLNEIVSNVPGIVWESVIDPQTKQRKTTFISDAVRKMLGYTPEEWLAADSGLGMRLMHEEDRDGAQREIEEVLASGKDGVSQYRCKAKDGRLVWFETHLSPITNPNGSIVGLRGVTLDITERKHAAEALRKTEEKDRAILNAIPDLMFVQTPDGVYLDYHAKNPKDLLVPPEQFLGKNMRDILPPELAQTFFQSFERASENHGPKIVEYKLKVDRTDRWFEARVVRVGENILSMVRDITEPKRATEELHASEERFAKAFQANPQPMSLTALATGRYVDVNASFLAMSGYTRAEVIGHTSLELGIWETPEARAEIVQHVLEYGSLINRETRFCTKDGSVRTLLTSAELLEIAGEQCLLVASSDITDRMRDQEALQESEARFRNMAETAPLMIWTSRTDKLCTYLSPNYLSLTGRSMEQVLGNGWTDDVHPDDYVRCLDTYGSYFDRREPFTMEFRLIDASGHYRWVYSSGTPRFSATGEFIGYIGTCLDITDRKEAEEELRKAHEEVTRLKMQLEEENIYLKEEIKLEKSFGEIIGKSDELRYILFKVEQVAPTDSTVLITGETGTGKELVARAIHSASMRKDRPLVKVNCAALSASLIESELFGHEKGAFTGAMARKIGRFELADGATIFLDEIGELPMELQVKLLRVIQEGEFERLGSSKTIKVGLRIIAATNQNLSDAVAKGRFREDLWYRLNVFPITMPPLRQRRDDIPLLVEHFTRRFSASMGKKVTSVSAATLRILCGYSWPGNVRELANVIERGVINSRGSVLEIADPLETPAPVLSQSATKTLDEMERDYITRILEERAWRVEGRNGAARLLGINPSTLRTRMNKLGIQKPMSLSATGHSDA